MTFKQRGGEDGEGGDILVSGTAAGMAVESASGGSTIEIMSGTFKSTREPAIDVDGSGIWYSNANAKLTISGGTFTGSVISGLRLAVDPGSNVQISGGTFTGVQTNAISSDATVYYSDILVSGVSTSDGGYTSSSRTNVNTGNHRSYTVS